MKAGTFGRTMNPEQYKLIKDIMRECWDISRDPRISRKRRENLRSLVTRAGELLNRLTAPRDWLCTAQDCGKRPFQDGPGKWRWDGDNWQHHHDYPVGHVHAEYKPKEA